VFSSAYVELRAALLGEQRTNLIPSYGMDEGRKRVIGIMAAILASLHCKQQMIYLEDRKGVPGRTG